MDRIGQENEVEQLTEITKSKQERNKEKDKNEKYNEQANISQV